MPTFAEFTITGDTTTSALSITPGAWIIVEVIGVWDGAATKITIQRKGSDAAASWQTIKKDGSNLELKEATIDAVRFKTLASEIRFVSSGTDAATNLKISVRTDRRP